MPLFVGLDLETTGLEPGDHRVIEFYAAAWSWDLIGAPEKVDELLLRINPERSIAADAQRVHHISLSDVERCPNWTIQGPKAHRALLDGDFIIAHNGKFFDGPFLNYEFQRIGLPKIEIPIIDTMLEGRWATPQGKVPNLGELCFATDVPYDDTPGKAHAADYDVDVMMQAFFKAVSWGFIKLPSPAFLSEAA